MKLLRTERGNRSILANNILTYAGEIIYNTMLSKYLMENLNLII